MKDQESARLGGSLGSITIALAVLIIIASPVLVWRNEQRLEEQAGKAPPGSLDAY